MRRLQLILIIAIAAVLVFCGLRLWQWNRGSGTGQGSEEEETAAAEDFDVEILDQVYTLTGADLAGKLDDGQDTILCLGNDTFAWDYENGLTRALREATGAEVRNGAFPGSTVTLSTDTLDAAAHPEDLFSFCHVAADIAAGDFSDLEAQVEEKSGEDYSFRMSLDTLRNTDYAALDTILIYYGAEDYLRQRSAYNPDEDKMWTDLKTLSGSYATGIRAIRAAYPHIRLVLVTPALVFTYTPEGTPVSGDRYDFGHGTIDIYVEFCQRVGEAFGVTVIDNYHGMTDEENANGYMVDTTHLSAAGNAALAGHIARVLYP